MDIEELLQQKKRKLEELKKQRLVKQQELISHFSSPEENNENDVKQSEIDYSITTENLIDNEKTKKLVSNTFSHVSGTIPSPPPRFLYTKNTDTVDLDFEFNSDLDVLKEELQRDLEKKIRKDLEAKFQKDFDKAVKTLNLTKNTRTEATASDLENIEIDAKKNLEYPVTKVKQIGRCKEDSAKFLTLHDDCVCIWEKKGSEFVLSDRISLYAKTNFAMFDITNSQKIITGSESGYIHIYDLPSKLHIQSKMQFNSIISMYQSSSSLIVLTLDGSYALLAMNLVDILSPLTNIFTSAEFASNGKIPLSHENIVISASEFINANNLVLALLTGEVISVDFGQRKVSLIFHDMESGEKLPIMSLYYNSGKLIILGLDHTVRIVSVTTGLNLYETIDLPDLTFSVDWLSPTLFVSCSIQNILTIWKLQNDKIVKLKSLSIQETKTAKLSLISCIKAIDADTLAVGELSGRFYTSNVN